MRGSIGQLLIAQGVIDGAALADALARQAGRHPVASELYLLGYATERELAAALAAQTGWPAIVLDESAIRLDAIGIVTMEWAKIFGALVVAEDESSLVVAAARPEDAIAPVRELGAARGKHIELRIALDVTLARTIRQGFARAARGARFLVGAEARVAANTSALAIVHPPGAPDEGRLARRALAAEAAREIEADDELPSETPTGDWQVNTVQTDDAAFEESTAVIAADLDRLASEDDTAAGGAGKIRALVVDADPPGRVQLVAELGRLGWTCEAIASGAGAVQLLGRRSFDYVFADVAAPDVDGLQLCRAIKRSARLGGRVKIVITTSVIDSGQVPDEVWQRHGADGYLEKPLDARRLHRLLRELAPDRGEGEQEAALADALARYHDGDIDGAVARLRGALVADPASAKLHFMLANMLQRIARWAEAVDEYEATVELQPQYFPALTRLAYLYFRQGLHARAVETWRRALPVCDDPALRRNIELFMRKLVADMAK